MIVCEVCFRAVDKEHVCQVAKKMLENPAPSPSAPGVNVDNARGMKPVGIPSKEWNFH